MVILVAGAGAAATKTAAAFEKPGLHGEVEVLGDGQVAAVVPQPERRDLAAEHPLIIQRGIHMRAEMRHINI
jgi:hypothetical protein